MTSPFIPRLPTLPGVGGPTFGGQQGAPAPGDPFEGLRALEKLERLSMAAEGVKAYEASQAAPEFIPPPAVEEPEDKSWWRNVIDPVVGGLQKYAAFTEAQTGLLGSPVSYTTGMLSKLGVPMGDEEERFDRLNTIRGKVLSGELSVIEGARLARDIHNERGGFHKFMLESTSPQGLLELLIPVGKAGAVLKPFTRAARPITRPVLKAAAPLAKAVPGLRRSQIGQEIRPGYAKQADEAAAIPEEILDESLRPVPELPGATQVIAQQTRAQETGFGQAIQKLAPKLEKIPLLGNLALTPIKWFNPNAIRDLSASNPNRFVEQYIIYDGIGSELARDSSKLMTLQVLSKGDPKKLFNLGDDFAYKAPTEGHVITRKSPYGRRKVDDPMVLGGRRRELYFNEIAQAPHSFNLSAAQTEWLDNFKRATDDMIDYLKKEGVVPEEFLTKGSVPGNYFPNFWKMLDDIPLGQATGDPAKTAAWKQSRYYELATEAINAGFRPGDPMEAVELLFHSMYRQVHEKELAKIARQMGNTMDQRISIGKRQAREEAAKKAAGTATARHFVYLFKFAGPVDSHPAFRGFQEAADAQPEIMKEFMRITGLRDAGDLKNLNKGELRKLVRTRKAKLAALEKKAEVAEENAQTYLKLMDKEYKGAKAAAYIRDNAGEHVLPFSGGDVILTSPEMAARVFPESMINSIKTVDQKEINRLKKAVEKSGNSFKVLTDVSNAMRTLRAGTDLGVMFIHGLPTLFRNPKVWAQSTKHSLEAFKDPTATARLIDDNWETVKDLVQFNQLHGGGSEFIEGLRDAGLLMRATGWAAKKPAIGIVAKGGEKYLKGVERQFDGWLLASKIHLWKAMKPMAIAGKTKGSPEYIKALDELASHVAKMTGTLSTANMGISPTTRNVMGTFLMFAPRYRMATYGLMADVVRGGVRGDQARKTMGSMLFAGISTYVIISNRLGQTPNLDPTDGKFLTLKIGNGRVGIGSAFVSMARFAGNIFETSMENPEDFVSLDSRDNPMMRFARGQLSPISGTGWDVTSGRNFIGEPTHGTAPFFENIVAEGLLPFWASSYTDTPRAGVGIGPAEFMGFRGFPINLSDQAEQLADIAAANFPREKKTDPPVATFAELTRYEQSKLLQANPDIQQMYDESNRLWLERSAGLPLKINEYRAGQKKIRGYYRREMDTFLGELQMGRFDARTFRNKVHGLNAARSAMYSELEAESKEAIDALNDLGDNPDAHAEDIAYQDYVQTIILGDFENEEGEFNFDAQSTAVSNWQKKWGSYNYTYVQKFLERDLSDLEKELRNGRQQHKTYWEVGERILQNMGYELSLDDWRTYMSARQVVKDEMDITNPIFKKVSRAQTLARQKMRDLNPELDKFLYKWNYTDTLRQGTPDRAELLISLLKY